MCVYHGVCVEARGQLLMLFLSTYPYVGFKDQIQVVRLSKQAFHTLNHRIDPKYTSFKYTSFIYMLIYTNTDYTLAINGSLKNKNDLSHIVFSVNSGMSEVGSRKITESDCSLIVGLKRHTLAIATGLTENISMK